MENQVSARRHQTAACFLSALLVVAGARFLRMGFKTWGELASFEVPSLAGFLALYVAAFVCIVMALVGPPDVAVRLLTSVAESLGQWPRGVRRVLALLNAFGPLVAVIYVVGRRMWTRWGVDYFGTDGLVFAQFAVDSLFEGVNPYAASMDAAFERYAVDLAFGTYRIDGSLVTELSYPAMSIWAFVPQKLSGIPCFDLTSLLALMVVFVWLVVRAPPVIKWAAPGMLWAEWGLVSFTAGGVFDILWTLPVLGTMEAFARRRFALAGVLFGIACSVKQTPWFIAPFILLWLAAERGDWRAKSRNIATLGACAAAAFVVVNSPFMIADFSAWMRGVLVPVTGGAPLVELGAGPIMFNIAGITQAPKAFFTLLMGAACMLTAIAYVLWFDRLKWFAFCAPMVILWFNYRSLHNYYAYLLPAALMGVVLKYSDVIQPPAPRRERAGLVFAVALGVSIAGITFAMVMLAPKTKLDARIAIADMRDPDRLGRISEIDVTLENDDTREIQPTFGIVHTGHQTPVHWRIQNGPEVLEPGVAATYRLVAPIPTATVPYEAAMHLAAYDRGSERRASLVLQRTRDVSSPLLSNPGFTQWGVNAENGHRQPLAWTARPSLQLPSERTTFAPTNGVSITIDGAEPAAAWQRLQQSSLEQTLERPIAELDIQATPGVVPPDLTNDDWRSGFELRSVRYCVLGVFVGQPEVSVVDRDIAQRHCKVIGLPATPHARGRTAIVLADLVGKDFLAHFWKSKKDTRLVLFARLGSGPSSAVTFHEVRAR